MSYFKFEESETDAPRRFLSLEGREIYQMPRLLSGKNEKGVPVDVPRTPITVKRLLHERVHGTHENDRNLLRNNYVHTGVAVIGNPNCSGEVIVGLYADPTVRELVHSLNPKSPLIRGSLRVNTEQYQAVKKGALVLSPDIANALSENAYSEQKAREEFWEYVAERDATLVRDTLALVQEFKGGSMKNRMGLYLTSDPGLRIVCVGPVGHFSDAFGSIGVGNGGSLGGIVGVAGAGDAVVAKKASPGIVRPTLEQTLVINNHNLKREDDKSQE